MSSDNQKSFFSQTTADDLAGPPDEGWHREFNEAGGYHQCQCGNAFRLEARPQGIEIAWREDRNLAARIRGFREYIYGFVRAVLALKLTLISRGFLRSEALASEWPTEGDLAALTALAAPRIDVGVQTEFEENE